MPLRLIDTHAHLDFQEYTDDRSEVINRAHNVGVEKIINIGCDEEHFKSTLEMATGHENLYGVIGVHPHEAVSLESGKDVDAELVRIQQRLRDYSNYQKLVGIGEVGLDFYRLARPHNPEPHSIHQLQEELFRSQLETAISLDLPVVIHSREAYHDVLRVIAPYVKRSGLRGVVHSFEGDYDTAKAFLDLGFKLSVNGLMTYERSRDTFYAVKKIPLRELMLETDSPYLTPVPLRGQRNEPAYVEYVAARIAELKKIPVEEIAEATTNTAINFFKLNTA